MFLGAFRELRKATICFVMSACASVRMEQPGSNRTDFHEVSYLIVFQESVEKIQVALKFEKKNGYFTWTPMNIYYGPR